RSSRHRAALDRRAGRGRAARARHGIEPDLHGSADARPRHRRADRGRRGARRRWRADQRRAQGGDPAAARRPEGLGPRAAVRVPRQPAYREPDPRCGARGPRAPQAERARHRDRRAALRPARRFPPRGAPPGRGAAHAARRRRGPDAWRARRAQRRPQQRSARDRRRGLRRAHRSEFGVRAITIRLLALALAAFAIGAGAQTYPAKPVRIIVPFPPGGTADLLTRLTAEKLTASFAQQFVVENRAGAGGNLAAEYVARAEPDGYTLLASPPHLLTINHLLYKLASDPARFVPISIIATYPNVLLAGPKLRVATMEQVIAAARERPGALAIASQGNGTSSHLSAELFKS